MIAMQSTKPLAITRLSICDSITAFDAICAMDEVYAVFGVKIEYADFRACSTVQDLFNTIERKRQNA